MKKFRIIPTAVAFTTAVIAAFSFTGKSEKDGLNIIAYDASNCTSTASVNCSENAIQSCTVNQKTYKQRDSQQACTVTLALN